MTDDSRGTPSTELKESPETKREGGMKSSRSSEPLFNFSGLEASDAPPSTGGGKLDIFEQTLSSVVKIFCTATTPHYAVPWQMKGQSSSTSSGFVISGRRILGNAHGVTNHTFIRVRKHGDATKYHAKLIAIAHECDLALLTVADESFWTGLTPLSFGDKIPRLQESIIVAGYPTGGDSISITKGVVSRVLVALYSHSGESLLAIQVDAAINSGNSGGPAFQGSQVVGVAFQTMTDAENIGYIIPSIVVMHFLNDIERNGVYTGFPVAGFDTQNLENPSMRKLHKIPAERHGVLLVQTQPLSDAAKVLRKGDVVTAVEGVALGDDGTIPFRRGERLSFRHLVSSRFVGDDLKMEISRDGQLMEVSIRLAPRQSLVPLHLHDKLPSYFVHAGLVFTVLSRAYLYHNYGDQWHTKAPISFVKMAYEGIKEAKDQEVVVLNTVLIDDVNIGYGDRELSAKIVCTVNDVKINNIRTLVRTIEQAEIDQVPFISVLLENERTIVLEAKKAIEATPRVLKQNNIAHAKSADLRALSDAAASTKAGSSSPTAALPAAAAGAGSSSVAAGPAVS